MTDTCAVPERGRKWVGAPSMALFALSLAILPLVEDFYSLLAVALVLGLANGLGSGIVMIWRADLAPPGRRRKFLGVWKLVGDLGHSSGPLLISALTEVASLALAT